MIKVCDRFIPDSFIASVTNEDDDHEDDQQKRYLVILQSDHHDPREKGFKNAHTLRRHASISLVGAQ